MKYFNLTVTIIAIFFIYKIFELNWRTNKDNKINYERIVNPLPKLINPYRIVCDSISLDDSFSTESEVYLKLYKNEIVRSANKWSIPASAIGGIIAAESSLNFDAAHRLEVYYFNNFVLNKSDNEIKKIIDEANVANVYNNRSNFFNKIHTTGTWSLGICQIRIGLGLKLDTLKSNVECRKPFSEREVISLLLNPTSNIEYCAFYMSYIREKYIESLHIDLNERPSILVTIFNIGNIDYLINKRIGNKSVTVNDLCNNQFGAFTQFYENKINSILELQ